MADPIAGTLLAGAERTLTGAGDAFEIGALRRAARIEVTVGAVVGTAQARVSIETRSVDTAPWRLVDKQVCNAEVRAYALGGLERYVRATWDISSGVTVFITVTIEAHVLYCEPRDLTKFGLPKRATQGVAAEDILEACIGISVLAEGYLNGQYTMPLTAWGLDVRMQCAKMIAALVLTNKGIDPEGPDDVIFTERDAATRWFLRVSEGKISPPGIVDSTPETNEGGSFHVGNTSRGW
jgi:hypothetical protein